MAETGDQNIYLLHPRTQKLERLISDGPGTITSMEFDDFGNNVYWINWMKYSVKVVNLKTSNSTTVFQGNSEFMPFDLTLAPYKRYVCLSISIFTTNLIENSFHSCTKVMGK